ncbi:class I SAM-dependent methyltransferase [Peptococcaceae bacterium 1198_IL3148]
MAKESCRIYESETIQQVTGSTVRPGGFTLTDRAMTICAFPAGAKLLDVGCGNGATVERLINQYHLQVVGIDPSPVMLASGKKRNANLPIFEGTGECLNFNDSEMDGVIAECTLSLMSDLQLCLKQVHRVLKPQGKLIVSDIYIRSEDISVHWHDDASTCLSGAKQRSAWLKLMTDAGFKIELWQDHTQLLKELMVHLIFTHGSMNEFWCQMLGGCQRAQKIQNTLQQVKLGYFLLIATKEEGDSHGGHNLSHV